MSNRHERFAVKVSPRVVERLKNAQYPDDPKSSMSNLKPTVSSLLARTEMQNLNQTEELQYEKTLQKMNAIFGKPGKLQAAKPEVFQKVRQELEKCYKSHPKESLYCSNLAKLFQQTVFNHQMKMIFQSQGIEYAE